MTRAIAAACATLVAGCSMSAFDDRREDAWSDSTGVAGATSSDYAVAVAGVSTDLPGATIAVLGLDPAGLGVVRYDETGERTVTGADLPELATASLPEAPALVAAPGPLPGANGLVAIGGLGNLDQILLYDVSTGAPTRLGALSGADCGAPGQDFGTQMAFGFTGAGAANAVDLVAIRGNQLFLFPDLDPTAATHECLRCGAGGTIDGLATIDIGFPDDGIMIAVGGALLVFDAFQVEEAAGASMGCFDIRTPQISNLSSPGGDADFGSRLAVGDADEDGLADVAATSPSNNRVYIVPNLTTSGPGGPTIELSAPVDSVAFGAGPLAFASLEGGDDGDELVVGDPLASPGGTSVAGQISVFTHSDDGDLELRAVLTDSTPEPGQQYGRALSEVEFVFGEDDVDLLAVGADDEVFSYFRALVGADDPRR